MILIKMVHKRGTLVIISGSTAKLGQEFISHFIKDKNAKIIGLTRKIRKSKTKNLQYLELDLLNKSDVCNKMNSLNLSQIKNIYLIHAVGKFKFEEFGNPKEDYDLDGIDDEVYDSNVASFLNIFVPLIKKIKKQDRTNLTSMCFGSITDKYSIPYWTSYTNSKNKLREILKNALENKDLKAFSKALFINVSTVDTDNENSLRPFADKSYWLDPKEIVKKSVKLLKNKKKWIEADIYKHKPEFDPSYYQNYSDILKRWKKEMTGK
jgi:NADP-dependent 3-hydroxy acid dehydrogenase YdfG